MRSFVRPTASCRGLTFDSKYLYVADAGAGGPTYQVDPVTGMVVRNFGNISHYSVTFDGVSLWRVEHANQLINQIDRITGAIKHGFATPVADNFCNGLAFDGKYLWSANRTTDLIYQIDPYTGAIVHIIASPDTTPYDLTFDGKYLWLAGATNDRIYQIDPYTGNVTAFFASPNTLPIGLTFDDKYLWHLDDSTGLIYQLSLS